MSNFKVTINVSIGNHSVKEERIVEDIYEQVDWNELVHRKADYLSDPRNLEI